MSRELRLGRGAYLTGQRDYCGGVCFRSRGHHGRHADISPFGRVWAVWGEDVYADVRHPDVPEWVTRCEHTPVCDTEAECDRQATADARMEAAERERGER